MDLFYKINDRSPAKIISAKYKRKKIKCFPIELRIFFCVSVKKNKYYGSEHVSSKTGVIKGKYSLNSYESTMNLRKLPTDGVVF